MLQIADDRLKKIPSRTWRGCIKKVWEVDPLECPKCGDEMKITSFIDEPTLIRHILEHLGLWRERIPKGLPPPEETIPDEVGLEEFDDGWGRYEEPSVTLH